MAETYTLYKLIVLYMLDKVDFPLTTSQISEFILDKGYTTYFRLQETLSELTDSGTSEDRDNAQPYTLPSDRDRCRHDPLFSAIRFHPKSVPKLMIF